MRIVRMTCLAAVLAAGGAASAQPLSGEAKALYEKMEQLKRSERDPLRQQIEERRKALAQEADLKDLHLVIEKAQKAYDSTMASDEEIVAARQAEKEAEQALKETTEAQYASNTKYHAIDGELKAAKESGPQLESEKQRIRRDLEKLKEEISKTPEFQPFKQVYEEAQRAYYSLPERHPKFVAARKAVSDAERALQERIKNLPETKAVEQVKKAYEDLRQNSPEIKEARKSRDDARAAYEKALDEALHANEKGAAAYARIEQIEQQQMEAEAKRYGLSEDLSEVRHNIEKSDPVILAARKAFQQAHEKYNEAVQRRAATERKSLDSARSELSVRIAKKMKLDPTLMNLEDRLKKVEKQVADLYAQYREAREKAERARRSSRGEGRRGG